MKRLTVFGLMTLALAATLLIGAGGWDDSRKIDPHSHENIPFAVVKDESGANDSVYYGELVKEPYSDRYLLVVNGDCDNAIDSSIIDTITLTLCPGPGTYQVKGYRPFGGDLDTFVYTCTTNTLGEFSVKLDSITRGGAVLLRLHQLSSSSIDTSRLLVHYDSATYYVNGRKLAIDRFGRIHVCYNDKSGSTYSVWYANSDDGGSTWRRQKIADNALCPAIAIDTFGIPWVSYMTYPDMDTMRIWSEGFYDILRASKTIISNAPAIALDFKQGVGVVYYSSRVTQLMDLAVLELPSLKTIHLENLSTGPFGGPLSCCITSEGHGLALGRRIASGKFQDDLSRQESYLIPDYNEYISYRWGAR